MRLPSPLQIREMRIDDLPDVMAIEQSALPTPWKLAGYRHELLENPYAHYHVLLRSDRLVGYAGYWLLGTEVEVSIVAVSPGHQGAGYGSALLLNLLQDALGRGAAVAHLEVREGNIRAQQLYDKFGFASAGRRKRYYKDTGEDALLMSLTIALPRLLAIEHALLQRLSS